MGAQVSGTRDPVALTDNERMPVSKPRLIIVDTNCYVRLYMSSVRPLLGSVVGGFRLMTLTELKLETSLRSNVRERFPWMGAADIQADLDGACLKLREPKKGKIEQLARLTRTSGNGTLAAHCASQGIQLARELSLTDARALAAADVLDASLATDEWPLRHVANAMGMGDPGQLFSSVELLHMLEVSGSLGRDERIQTVRAWIQQAEALHRGWQARYAALFGEAPPDGQSDNSASA